MRAWLVLVLLNSIPAAVHAAAAPAVDPSDDAFVKALQLGAEKLSDPITGHTRVPRGADRGPNDDWHEDAALPYLDGWLYDTRVLGGFAQTDHLPQTVDDDFRCSAQVAVAAAVVAGRASFERLLSDAETRRAHDAQDASNLAEVRADLEAATLRARDLHYLADGVYRSYAARNHGAGDGQIAQMLRASGLPSRYVGTSKPAELLQELRPREAFPLTLDMNSDGTGWHVVLVWRGEDGVARIYDSSTPGQHVMAEGSREFAQFIEHDSARWPLREIFRLPRR